MRGAAPSSCRLAKGLVTQSQAWLNGPMFGCLIAHVALFVGRHIFGMIHKTPEELELLVRESWRIWLEGPFPHSSEDGQP
jgi:hypothetical protein